MIDETGRHYSKEPMPKEQARQQQKALYAAESRGEFKGRAVVASSEPPLPPPNRQLKKGHYIDAPVPRPKTDYSKLRVEIPVQATEQELLEQETPPRRPRRVVRRGGATAAEASAAWAAQPPPKKLSYETEDQYQQRLLRIKQQNERFAASGVTPEMREGALTAQSKARGLEQLKQSLGAEKYQQSPEFQQLLAEQQKRYDARVAALEDLKQKEQTWGPLLRGLTSVADVASTIGSVVGGPLGKVSSVYDTFRPDTSGNLGQIQAELDYLARQKEIEQSLRPQREARAAELAAKKQSLGLDPNAPVSTADLSNIQRQLEEARKAAVLPMATRTTGGSYTMPRFAEARYF